MFELILFPTVALPFVLLGWLFWTTWKKVKASKSKGNESTMHEPSQPWEQPDPKKCPRSRLISKGPELSWGMKLASGSYEPEMSKLDPFVTEHTDSFKDGDLGKWAKEDEEEEEILKIILMGYLRTYQKHGRLTREDEASFTPIYERYLESNTLSVEEMVIVRAMLEYYWSQDKEAPELQAVPS